MNQRRIGTILSYAHILLTNTISLFYTPYMLRMMGKSEYGLYGTANSLIAYLSILSFGIGGAYIRFNAIARAKQDKQEEYRINGMFIAVFSFLAFLVLVCGSIMIFFAGTLVKNTFSANELLKLRIIMLLLIINMAVTFVCNVFMMALQAYERFIFVRAILLIAGILQPILNIISLNMGGRAISITALSLVISIVTYLLFFVYAWNVVKFRVSFRGFDKAVFKELFVFSGFLFLNSITEQITFSTDNVVLSAVHGTEAVAVYTVGSSFKNYFMNFSSSVSSVFAPQVNKIIAENGSRDELNSIFIKLGRIQFYIVSIILIGYCSIGHDFVRLWAGKDYSNAYYIGLLLMMSIFVPSFQNVGIEIQKAMNMHKARSIVYFFIALINVIITIPLSIYLAGVGAALATTICMFFGTVVFMNCYYHKKIGLDMYMFWKSIASILPGYVIPIVVAISINKFAMIRSFIDILIYAMIISLVYIVSVFMISMNSYEKDLFIRPLKKLLRRN